MECPVRTSRAIRAGGRRRCDRHLLGQGAARAAATGARPAGPTTVRGQRPAFVGRGDSQAERFRSLRSQRALSPRIAAAPRIAAGGTARAQGDRRRPAARHPESRREALGRRRQADSCLLESIDGPEDAAQKRGHLTDPLRCCRPIHPRSRRRLPMAGCADDLLSSQPEWRAARHRRHSSLRGAQRHRHLGESAAPAPRATHRCRAQVATGRPGLERPTRWGRSRTLGGAAAELR